MPPDQPTDAGKDRETAEAIAKEFGDACLERECGDAIAHAIAAARRDECVKVYEESAGVARRRECVEVADILDSAARIDRARGEEPSR